MYMSGKYFGLLLTGQPYTGIPDAVLDILRCDELGLPNYRSMSIFRPDFEISHCTDSDPSGTEPQFGDMEKSVFHIFKEEPEGT